MLIKPTSMGVLCALAGTAVADVPASGVLVASQTSFVNTGTDEHFYIHRIKPTGIEQVFASKSDPGEEFGWSDAHTLWTASGTAADAVSITKFVDGVQTDAFKIVPADWKLTPFPDDLKFELPRLMITGKGQVWLELCQRRKEPEIGEGACTNARYARVNERPLRMNGDAYTTIVTTKPAGVDAYRVKTIFQGGKPIAFPRTNSPAGYAVKLARVTVDGIGDEQKHRTLSGAVCIGPAKETTTFPGATDDIDFVMVPKKVTWIRTSPPLVELAGKATNPVGQVEAHTAYLLGCNERIARAEFFGADLWGMLRIIPVAEWQKQKQPPSDGTWSIYLADKLLGTIPGSEIRVAPH